jgi:hypothetical protein
MIPAKVWRTWVLLKEIQEALGPAEFGRVCQILFAMTLLRLGFRISVMQLSGRPDIAARRRRTFAFEVKAPSGDRVLVTTEDLQGVRDQGEICAIAVLTFPDMRCEWTLANAAGLSPGVHEKAVLRRRCLRIWQGKVNREFPHLVSDYREQAKRGARALKKSFELLAREAPLPIRRQKAEG